MFADVVVCGVARFTDPCLVHGSNSELVDHLLLETFDLALRVVVLGLGHFLPVHGELVLHLHDVVEDGPASITVWLLPLECNTLVVIVNDFRLSWPSRLI